MSDVIAAFIRDRLDDEERVATAARSDSEGRWKRDDFFRDSAAIVDDTGKFVVYDEGSPTEEQADHIAAHDPARVLRQVAALRAVVDEHYDINEGDCATCVEGQWGYPTHGSAIAARWPCKTLRHLAAIWHAHEAYKPGWAPGA